MRVDDNIAVQTYERGAGRKLMAVPDPRHRFWKMTSGKDFKEQVVTCISLASFVSSVVGIERVR